MSYGVDVKSSGRWFRLGIVLLAVNQPFGWGLVLIFGGIAFLKNDHFYDLLGAGAYVVSWIMFLLGLALAGPRGVRYVRIGIKRTRNRIRRFTSRQ